MHVLDVNEIFGMPFYTYERIMEEGGKNGADAFALYVKLIEQSRIQQTNQTYTLNKFLENYFGRGHEKIAKVKNILKKLGLIDDVVIRGEGGKLQGHYVRVNYLIDEQKIRNTGMTYNLTTSLENRQSVSTTCGETATNALSNKHINAGSNKNKKGNKKPSASLSELVEAYRNDDRVNQAFLEEDVIEWLEYKESRKELYAKPKGFIQQLVVAKRTITQGQPKLDIQKRFSFAVNDAISKNRQGIHWYDETEREYLATKKDLFPNPNLNE